MDVLFIVVLILCNGLLSMSEMALVSARRSRLQQEANRGRRGAIAALRLVAEPSDFLAAVQVGITLVGVLAGAFGGANIAEAMAVDLEGLPVVGEHAEAIALAIVVTGITILSIVFGELIPKRVALARADEISILVSQPVEWLAAASRPVVFCLAKSTEAIVKLFGFRGADGPAVTDEDLRSMVEEGTRTGALEKEEETIIKRTLLLGDRTVEEIMIRRNDVVFFDVNQSLSDVLEIFRAERHSFYPVYEGQPDQILGVVSAKDLLAECTKGGAFSLRAIIREPLYVVESLLALKILQIFRDSGHHFALVFDEHGAMTGIVSVIDVLESIVGDFPASGASEDQPIVRRDDGSWLVDGTLSLDDVRLHMMQESGVVDLRFSEDIKTLGGFVMNEIGRIPKVGESFVWNGWSFEVVDMDGRRVDKVLLLHPTPHKETGG